MQNRNSLASSYKHLLLVQPVSGQRMAEVHLTKWSVYNADISPTGFIGMTFWGLDRPQAGAVSRIRRRILVRRKKFG